MTSRTRLVSVLATATLFSAAVTLTPAPVAAGEGPASLDKRISLDLAGAAAIDVFNSFAAINEAEPDLDPALEGKVTLQLTKVSTRTTMNAVCEMLDCKWWFEEGPPRTLRVKAQAGAIAQAKRPPGDLNTPVTLSLLDAPVEEIFKSFASIGHWKLVLEKTTVSIELQDAPIHQALDEVCAQVDCIWSLDEVGDEGVLRIDWID